MERKILKNNNAFTLIEIIVAVVILGILTCMVVPFYTQMVMQANTQAAQNNLLIIYNAEKAFFLNNARYCISTTAPLSYACAAGSTTCGANLSQLNCNLNLNITDDVFGYTCTPAFCQAQYPPVQAAGPHSNQINLSLILTNPIVLPGSTSTTRNPSCGSTISPSPCPS